MMVSDGGCRMDDAPDEHARPTPGPIAWDRTAARRAPGTRPRGTRLAAVKFTRIAVRLYKYRTSDCVGSEDELTSHVDGAGPCSVAFHSFSEVASHPRKLCPVNCLNLNCVRTFSTTGQGASFSCPKGACSPAVSRVHAAAMTKEAGQLELLAACCTYTSPSASPEAVERSHV